LSENNDQSSLESEMQCKKQTNISCTPIYREGGKAKLHVGSVSEGLGWVSALKERKPHYEEGRVVYVVIEDVPGRGVGPGETLHTRGGSPQTVSLHMPRLGDLVSGSDLSNKQHLDVTLSAYWAMTEEANSHL